MKASLPPTLCAACANVRLVESAKGSVFFLCRLSATDPRFAKYPRQPVVDCTGFRVAAREDGPESDPPGTPALD